MSPNCFGQHLWLFPIGACLATVCLGLAIFHPGSAVLFLVPLPMTCAAALAGSCFWFRARNSPRRERIFWQLWAWGCWLSTVAGIFVFFSLAQPAEFSVRLFGLAFTFLPQVLFMAALVMQPEQSDGQLRDPVVRYEAALVALWWLYLYALIIFPWQWVLPNSHKYLLSFARLHDLQNASLALWLVALWLATRGPWRRAYGHFTGAFVLWAVSTDLFYRSWNSHRWLPTLMFQALIAAAFLWLSRSAQISTAERPGAAARRAAPTLGAGAWLASITAIGIPLLAFWASLFSGAPEPIQRFRLGVSFATLVAATLLLYRWQDVAESQKDRLVEDLETSVRELRQLQGQFAEAEKLASLGQLAAGAAHEINNPLTAILGYSELLQSDPLASSRVREFGRKIGEQTRRIRNLVKNLLSLTEQEAREMETLDISIPLRSALELRRISTGRREQNIALVVGEGPFQVRGDREKMLQVFYRLLLALSEGDTRIEVRLRGESNGGRVMVEFIGKPDSSSSSPPAPEIYNAQIAQQGKQLSLTVCDTIVKEHGGSIVHQTGMDGGKVFRVELPATGGGHRLARPSPKTALLSP